MHTQGSQKTECYYDKVEAGTIWMIGQFREIVKIEITGHCCRSGHLVKTMRRIYLTALQRCFSLPKAVVVKV